MSQEMTYVERCLEIKCFAGASEGATARLATAASRTESPSNRIRSFAKHSTNIPPLSPWRKNKRLTTY